MENLLFALGAVAPLILTAVLGYVLRRVGVFPLSLAAPVNKLVFRVFLPILLFLNIYNIDDPGTIEPGYLVYAAVAILVFFFLGIPLAMWITKDPARRGPVLQCVFRSNYALIGIPLATSLFGTEGSITASLLCALTIPMFNILAVISLSVFRPRTEGDTPAVRDKIADILRGVAKNPLIHGILLGLLTLALRALFVRHGIAFRLSTVTPVYTVLKNLSALATPLALLVLGVQFDFHAIPGMKREILAAVLLRTILVPAAGLGAALLFFPGVFSGSHYAALVALFATPVAVSSVPMAQEMGADAPLAGQLVLFTTLASGVTMFAFSYILRLLGIF